jgi:nucleoside-diphosphate-sugar epimerase
VLVVQTFFNINLLIFIPFSNGQFIIGDGNNIYDFTYVENVAHAHVCAERALASEGTVAEKAAGQVPLLLPLD